MLRALEASIRDPWVGCDFFGEAFLVSAALT